MSKNKNYYTKDISQNKIDQKTNRTPKQNRNQKPIPPLKPNANNTNEKKK